MWFLERPLWRIVESKSDNSWLAKVSPKGKQYNSEVRQWLWEWREAWVKAIQKVESGFWLGQVGSSKGVTTIGKVGIW
jgi:soluble lytic murein transglycosylase-like protein